MPILPRSDGPPPVPLLFTPLLVGFFLSTILFGVICTQVTTYFTVYGRRDVWWLRCLIFYLFIAEAFMTVAEFGICYEPFIMRWGQPRALAISPAMLPADGIGTVMISTPVQLYLGWRLKIVTNHWALWIIISVLSLASFAGGILVGYNVILSPEYRTFGSFAYAPTLWLACSAICDVLISGGLVWFLWRNKTGFSRTKSVVDKIIISTVQSGIATSFVAIITLIIFLSIPDTTLMFVFDFSLSKVYYTSLLSTLISRKHWNELINSPLSTTTDHAISLGSLEPNIRNRNQSTRHTFGPPSRGIPHIEINTQVETSVSKGDFDAKPGSYGLDITAPQNVNNVHDTYSSAI